MVDQPAVKAKTRVRKTESRLQKEAREAYRAEAAPAAPEPVAASPERKPLRAKVREEDPQERAKRRAAEIRQDGQTTEEGTDNFYVPRSIIPDGWAYEWKRKSILNQEDPAYQTRLERAGWEPVPAHRHPEFMPAGGKYETIERDGMILMERPKVISDAAKAAELKRARLQVRHKEAQLNAAPDGQFERSNKDASLVKVNKSYEAMVIPE